MQKRLFQFSDIFLFQNSLFTVLFGLCLFVCVYVCVYVCEYRSIGSTDVSRFELYKHPLHNIGAAVFVCALNKGIKNCEMPSLRFHGVVFELAIMALTLLGWFYD